MPRTPGGFFPFGIKVLEDHASRISGRRSAFTLHVSEGFSERVLYACGTGLFVFSIGERSGPGLAATLIRAEKLTEADFDEAVASSRFSGASLRDALVATGRITAEEHDEAARRLVLDEVLDLVFWEEALFTSYEAPPPTDFFAAETHLLFADIAPGVLEDEIASWIRKWLAWKPALKSDVIPLRLEPSGSRSAAGSAGADSVVLRALKKGGTLRSLRKETGMGLPEICGHVGTALESGFLSIAEEAPPPPGARQSIEKLEKILPQSLGKDLVRLKLAGILKRAGEPEKACAHLQLVADQAASRSDRALASECFRSLLAIKPDDTAALRSLVEIHCARGRVKEAVLAALQVEQALFKEGKAEPMRAVAEILGELGEHLSVQEVNADLKALEGRVDEALEEYRGIAGRHEAAGDLERAVQTLGKALQLDGEDQELKTRLVRLKQRAHGGAPPAGRGRAAEPRLEAESGRDATPSHRLVLRGAAGILLLIGVFAAAVILLGTGEHLEVDAVVPLAEAPPPDPETELDEPAASEEEAEAPGPPRQGKAEALVSPRSPPVPRRAAVSPSPSLSPTGVAREGAPSSSPAPRPVKKSQPAPPSPRPPAPASASRPAAIVEAHPAKPAPGRQPPSGRPAEPREELPPAPLPPGAAAPSPRVDAGEPGPIAAAAEPTRADPSGTVHPPPAADAPERAAGTPASTGAASGSAEKIHVPSPRDLFGEVLPREPCERHGRHVVMSRRLAGGKRIRFADGCFLRIEDAATGELVTECEGEEGSRWAHDAAGERICRWSPGQPLRSVSARRESPWPPEGWRVPRDAAALAIGAAEIALLARGGTRVIRFPGGEETVSEKVPPWMEGFFSGGYLLLQGVPFDGGKEPAERWFAVDSRTLERVTLPGAPAKRLPAGIPVKEGPSSGGGEDTEEKARAPDGKGN